MSRLTHWLRSAGVLDRARWELLADGMAIAMAISVPWSTSATLIFAGVWLVALIPTLNATSLRRVLATPAGGLPILLLVLALVGTLWAADVTMADRVEGLRPYFKILAIPLLMMQFSRSERGVWVAFGFLISCGMLMVTSWILVLRWALSPDLRALPLLNFAMPVRDYIAQSGEFTICIFLLAKIALEAWRAQRHQRAIMYLFLMAAFLANIFCASVSRTMLVVIPALLVAFAWQNLPRRGIVGLLLASVVMSGLISTLVPPVRTTIIGLFSEVNQFQLGNPMSRAGLRLEFWGKSVEFIAAAPLIGHGIGSQLVLFRPGVDRNGETIPFTTNPHNQILAVGMRLGLAGTAVLLAFWLSHLMLFRDNSFVAWTGLVVVLQNFVGSLFNSHLFDFAQGWLYVVGIGVAGGMVIGRQAVGQPAGRPA